MQQYSLLLFCVLLFSYNNSLLLSGIKIHETIFTRKCSFLHSPFRLDFSMITTASLRCSQKIVEKSKFCGVRCVEKSSHCIVSNKNKKTYCGGDITNFVLNEHPGINKKKLITISPGGFTGFYMLGIVAYIKAHYDLSPKEYIFSGSSAGAWNALVMAYKGDGEYLSKILYNIIHEVNKDFKKGSIQTMQKRLRHMILDNFNDEDFALDNLFIGITHLNFLIPHTTIYTGFESLSDAIDCCIASSHIPFLTGDIVNNYRGLNAFDGGFLRYPYLNLIKPILEIKSNIWTSAQLPYEPPSLHYYNKCNLTCIARIQGFTTLFSKNIYNLVELFELGFLETFENKVALDSIFL